MAKINLKNKAIELRKAGYSYGYISQTFGVSKGTLTLWLSHIKYIPNEETITKIGKARIASGIVKSKHRQEALILAKIQARQEIGLMTKRDLFMLGIGLYIGEGSKTSNVIRIINSNPNVICLALKWFKEVCNIEGKAFSIRLHLYPDNNISKCIEFWSATTEIPKRQFSKPSIDTRKNKKLTKKGKLPFGTAHLSVKTGKYILNSVSLSKRINAWMEEVLIR